MCVLLVLVVPMAARKVCSEEPVVLCVLLVLVVPMMLTVGRGETMGASLTLRRRCSSRAKKRPSLSCLRRSSTLTTLKGRRWS